jgi:hypothetical protein
LKRLLGKVLKSEEKEMEITLKGKLGRVIKYFGKVYFCKKKKLGINTRRRRHIQ